MIPWTVTHLGYPLSAGYPRQEYWSGLPIPSPGDLSDPGTEPGSPALPADSLPIELPEEAHYFTDNQCLFVRTPLTYCFQDCKFTCICLHSFHFLLYYNGRYNCIFSRLRSVFIPGLKIVISPYSNSSFWARF